MQWRHGGLSVMSSQSIFLQLQTDVRALVTPQSLPILVSEVHTASSTGIMFISSALFDARTALHVPYQFVQALQDGTSHL